MTDLDKLIEAVEAGSIAPHDLDAFIPTLGLTTAANYALDAYRGSLDAAKALHDALLPGWWCELRLSTRPRAVIGRIDPESEGQDGCLARAWLLAILKAHRAQDGKGGGE